jgi:hypothetical protein
VLPEYIRREKNVHQNCDSVESFVLEESYHGY